MLTVTASDIISQARSAADAETSTPTVDHVTDAELLKVLTRAYRSLIDYILAEDGGLELLATSATLTAPYALPADFYRHVALEIPDDTNAAAWRSLAQAPFRQRNDWADASRPRYRIVGNTLALFPSSAAPASIRLWYVAFPAALTSGSDVTKSVNGWDDFLVASLAAYICAKEDRDTSVHSAARVEAVGRVRKACKDISLGDTTRIADVECQPEEFFDTAYWTV